MNMVADAIRDVVLTARVTDTETASHASLRLAEHCSFNHRWRPARPRDYGFQSSASPMRRWWRFAQAANVSSTGHRLRPNSVKP